MKIGVYVGSFNPPHKAHLALVNHLLKKGYVDKVMIIATGNYWDKQNLIAKEHRINMLRFFANDNIIVDDTLNDLPYTYQVMEALHKLYPHIDSLIIGSDNLASFHLWKNYQDLLQNEVLVIPRGNILVNENIPESLRSNIKIVQDYQPINISSTNIRERLEKDDDLEGYECLLDYRVFHYILKNRLYKQKNNKVKTKDFNEEKKML